MKQLLFSIHVLLISTLALAQPSTLLEEAKSYERQYKTLQAIAAYQEYKRQHPKDIDAVVRIAELYVMYADEVSIEVEKKKFLDSAQQEVLYGFSLDSLNANCFYARALLMGKQIEFVSVKEKAALTKAIKEDADYALIIDPQNVKAMHLLGKWNMEVAALNPAARAAMKIVFGGLPNASKETALELLQEVRKRSPNFLANNYDLSMLYKTMGRPREAIELLQVQMKLPTKTMEDVLIKKRSKELLDSLL
jgi:tetratricopeptide (TPR) repeat protein